jgi:hypothetical protein
MGKRAPALPGQTTVTTQEPGQRSRREVAILAEPDVETPAAAVPAEVPEVYGFGAAGALRAGQRQDAADDPLGAVERQGQNAGLTKIQAALQAPRAEQVAPVGNVAENDVPPPISPPAAAATPPADAITPPPATSAGTDSPTAQGAPAPTAATESTLVPAQRDALIAHLVSTTPDAVHELIGGNTVTVILASVETAKGAYARTAAAIAAKAPVTVGAGARQPTGQQARNLPPMAKIAIGVNQARQGA